MMDSVEIRFCGSGGQGLILAARILSAALVAQGKNVAQSQSYEPVSRGGQSRSDLVISDGEADFPLGRRLDYLLILDEAAAQASDGMISDDTVVLADFDLVQTLPDDVGRMIHLPFTQTAHRLGNKRVANIVALGALATASGICDKDGLLRQVKAMTPAKFARLNIEAFEAGTAMA